MEAIWTRVSTILAENDLLTHPFYTAWSRGELTAAQLAFYGEQYVHHVAEFPAYLTALHARMPEGATRRAVLANAADEEIEGRSHADIWRQFTAGMTAKSDRALTVGERAVLPEIASLVGAFRAVAREGATAEALAAFYAYESQVPRIAAEKRKGLMEKYGADAATCEYFRVHETADVAHSTVWRTLLDRELGAAHAESPEAEAACEAAIARGTETAARALWRALDGIERERVKLD